MDPEGEPTLDLVKQNVLEDAGPEVPVACDDLALASADEAWSKVRALVDLFGVVAHDLRNALNTISMSAALLLREVPNDRRTRGRRRAEAIQRAGQQMERLIHDLLDLAMVEAGQLPIERTLCRANALVQDAADSDEASASEKGIRLVVELDPDEPEVSCDRGRIQQIFANLIGNAIKFTPESGTIVVRVWRDVDVVRFSVADDGCGIAKQELEHIFDRFWHANRAMRGGTGLGLAIAKRIIESHGGRIWAASELGRGTTLFFTLPAAAPEAAAPAKTEGEIAAESARSIGRTVLIVDDELDQREALAETLEREGFLVEMAENGAEAIAHLRVGSPPALVVLDLDMPILDGRAFLEERDRDPRLGAIPVIVASGLPRTEDGVERPRTALLPKPIRCDRLLEVIRWLVG
jgi:CheY-like chemotaxis protein